MKIRENIATVLMAAYLIAGSLVSLLRVHIPVVTNLLPLVALVAGILFILGSVQLTRSAGVLFLAVWLILKGLTPFLYVPIPYFGFGVDIIAILAGLFLILRK
ncbi:MAG TPA: hypothetical protein ENN17_00895 [bacterium]|nr:hypothetical protein [bacterium]